MTNPGQRNKFPHNKNRIKRPQNDEIPKWGFNHKPKLLRKDREFIDDSYLNLVELNPKSNAARTEPKTLLELDWVVHVHWNMRRENRRMSLG